MYSYTVSGVDDMIANAEKCKGLVIDKLVKEKYLTKKQADDFLDRWQFVIFKPSLYKRLFNNWFKTKEEQEKQKDSIHIQLVKLGE